jgi:hypothetical protein
MRISALTKAARALQRPSTSRTMRIGHLSRIASMSIATRQSCRGFEREGWRGGGSEQTRFGDRDRRLGTSCWLPVTSSRMRLSDTDACCGLPPPRSSNFLSTSKPSRASRCAGAKAPAKNAERHEGEDQGRYAAGEEARARTRCGVLRRRQRWQLPASKPPQRCCMTCLSIANGISVR